MKKFFYSPSTGGFYSPSIPDSAIPSDAVEVTAAEHADLLTGLSSQKLITIDPSGLPILIDPPPPAPPTREQVEAQRLRAYADPLTGSDRYFAEAVRLQATGAPQEEIDAAKAAGAKRYAEIQADHPWP